MPHSGPLLREHRCPLDPERRFTEAFPWRRPNGGNHGRQVTEGETARPEAEGRCQERGRGPGEVQARQLPPDAIDSGKGQEVARRCLTHDEAAMKSIANKTQKPLRDRKSTRLNSSHL